MVSSNIVDISRLEKIRIQRVNTWLRKVLIEQQGFCRADECMKNQYITINTMYDYLSKEQQLEVYVFVKVSNQNIINSVAAKRRINQAGIINITENSSFNTVLFAIGPNNWKEIELYMKNMIYKFVLKNQNM